VKAEQGAGGLMEEGIKPAGLIGRGKEMLIISTDERRLRIAGC